jgi:protein PET100, fungi type
MYYFGTNLDGKFSVPGFWPTKEQTHRLPTERSEVDAELDRLKAIRLEMRRRRLLQVGELDEQTEARTMSPGRGVVNSVKGRWQGREG